MKPLISNSFALDSPHDRWLCQILRGEVSSWPARAGAEFERRFLEACLSHGVAPLVYRQARMTTAWQGWPAAVRESLSREARMQAALDMVRERELMTVLGALAAAGVGALLLKGTPLAYSHYAEPALRPRCDMDLLVAPANREAAVRVLRALGYWRPNAVSGKIIGYESCYCKKEGKVEHVVDLHWRINNSQVFARAFGYDELHARSMPIPRLGESARGLSPPHALLLACMHRVAHLDGRDGSGERLIWLYDIHLLANAMKVGEWREFARLASVKDMRRICLDGFACTCLALGTVFPDPVLDRLAASATDELSGAYLRTGRWGRLVVDLRALASWRDRATLLWELCFPPADFLLAKYQVRSRWLLPWLYARRAMAGIWKLK
jgi:hypothetical protein